MPLSWRFCLDWLGPAWEWAQSIAKAQYWIQKAKSFLIAKGLMHAHHEEDGMTFWQIGSKALRHDRREAPIFKTEQENVADVDATPVLEPIQDDPPACRQCGTEGFSRVSEGCEWCVLLLPAQARLEEKKRLYGSPQLVDLPRIRGDTTYAT